MGSDRTPREKAEGSMDKVFLDEIPGLINETLGYFATDFLDITTKQERPQSGH